MDFEKIATDKRLLHWYLLGQMLQGSGSSLQVGHLPQEEKKELFKQSAKIVHEYIDAIIENR